MVKVKFWSGVVGLVVVLSLVVAACQTATPTTQPTVATPTATPTATPAAKRKLTMVYGMEPGKLWFYELSEGEFIPRNIYEALVDLDTKTGQPIPKLATKWEQVEPTRWRFTLRQGVKFHSGAEFTSQDVVDSVKWLAETKGVVFDYTPASDAVAVDKYTVDIVTPGPDPLFPRELFFLLIYPSAIAKDNRNLANASANGTGPYKLVEWKRGDKMVLTFFENYWGPKPQITDADILFRSEEGVRLAMVRTGEAQWVYGLLPEQAQSAPKAVRSPSNETWFLRLDNFIQGAELGRVSLLSDKRLRLALQHAIDRKALANSLYLGFGTPAKAQTGKPGYFGYDPTLEDYPFDLAKAKALVQEAGAVGKTITYASSAGRYLKDKEFNQAVAYMIEQTGLKVSLMFLEYKEWLNYGLTQGENRKIMSDIFAVASSVDTLITSYTIGSYARTGGALSATSDPKVDSMYQGMQAEGTLDLKEQKLRDIFKYVREESLIVFLLSPDWVWGLSKNLEWTPGPDARPIIAEMRFTD